MCGYRTGTRYEQTREMQDEKTAKSDMDIVPNKRH
jgi:hypothetical protein